MKPSSLLRPLFLAATIGAATVSFGSPAQAGLFDFLFGGARPAPSYGPTYSPTYRGGAPLGVKVNPRKKRDVAGSPKRMAGDKAKGGRERKALAQKSIDPVKHPNWYLEDPTLRRGDIVVLKSGVMVYDGGGKPQTKQDFTSLSKSRLVSKAERERIQKMAPLVDSAAVESPAANKEAGLTQPPVQ